MNKRKILTLILVVVVISTIKSEQVLSVSGGGVEIRPGCRVDDDPVYGTLCGGLCEINGQPKKCIFNDDNTICGVGCPTATPTPKPTPKKIPSS